MILVHLRSKIKGESVRKHTCWSVGVFQSRSFREGVCFIQFAYDTCAGLFVRFTPRLELNDRESLETVKENVSARSSQPQTSMCYTADAGLTYHKIRVKPGFQYSNQAD